MSVIRLTYENALKEERGERRTREKNIIKRKEKVKEKMRQKRRRS
jgi:hypothetical protein